MPVTLTPAVPAQAPLLENMAQLYIHDFSEFWAGTPRGDLLPNGRFESFPLEGFWTRPNWSASLIWNDDVLAGFALVNDQAHCDEPVERSVAEFFVLRKHRSQGVGRLAAEIVFSQHPGSWEVAIARKNVRAGVFWRRTIKDATRASGLRELDVSTTLWNGPIVRFNWAAQ